MTVTTRTGRAPTILTQAGARKLTARLRDALVVADDLLARALEGRIWEPLGYADFTTYCAAELPDLRHVKLRTPERRARTKALLDADPSVTERAIAAATGASPATAHRDVLAVTGREVASSEASQPAEIPSPVAAPEPMTAYRAAAYVAAQGARGMTYIELTEAAGCRGGQATGALSRAHWKLGLIRPAGRFRDNSAVYVGC